MEASNITEQQLRDAAEEIGVDIDMHALNRKMTRFRVKVNPRVTDEMRTPYGNRKKGEAGDAKYQRTGVSTGHRVHAVCWHGFRDFFRACFERAPEAKFKTAMDTWNGAEDFEARYRESGMRNVGSQMMPMSAAEACSCPESGWVI